MSPTVFREKGYRFFFFSREETRMHVHVYSGEGEAKFWLDPHIELARNFRLLRTQIKEIEQLSRSTTMSLSVLGKNTSPVEVTHVSKHGIWLLVGDRELFMSYDQFPWFKDVPVGKILNVEEPTPGHFYWPDLDVDLSEEIIAHQRGFLSKPSKANWRQTTCSDTVRPPEGH